MTDARSPAPDGESATPTIEEQAARWFGRCELGLTREEEREFFRWLEADTRHGEALREIDETWDYLNRLKESARLRATATPHRHFRFAPLALTAAAALIALTVLWRPREPAPLIRQATTEAGGMKQIELPDGSVVHLNADSAVDLHFNPAERRVRLLRGEAHFAVAKDPARPFVVVAGDVAVTAVGTAFNVRRGSRGLDVIVVEGKVRVDDARDGSSLLARSPATDHAEPAPHTPDGPEILAAGQRAVVPEPPVGAAAPVSAVVAPIAAAEISEALAWRARQLDFDQKPLAEVVAEFNRYNDHQLVIADPQLARQPFGGSFRADNYRIFVQLLEERFGLVAERSQDRTVLRRSSR